VGTSLPTYLYRRRDAPIRDGVLSSRLAALYKVCAGVHMTVEHLVARGDPAAWAAAQAPRAFYDYVEEHKLFVAATGRVCAGPRGMVEELLRHLLAGEVSAEAQRAPVHGEVGDLEPIIDYGLVAARIDVAVRLFGHAVLRALAPCLEGAESAADGGFAERLARAWPEADRDAARLDGAVGLGRALFDHLPPLAGVSSDQFWAAKAAPELQACLDEHLAAHGVRNRELALAVGSHLALQASARRGFTALLHAARRSLGRPAGDAASLAAVHARLARDGIALDTRPALGLLGLAVGEGERGLELHLPGAHFDL
jgi:hypothetical protein